MNIADYLKLLEILVWPLIALVALLVVRPHITQLLSGAKVKFSVAGQGIETTLPELKRIFEEQSGDPLTPEQFNYLQTLQRSGAKSYPGGVKESNERKFLRPLRNIGLILAIPRDEFLQDATGIELSALGRLYIQARSGDKKRDA